MSKSTPRSDDLLPSHPGGPYEYKLPIARVEEKDLEGSIPAGTISLSMLVPGTNGQFIRTTGGVAVWAAIAAADVGAGIFAGGTFTFSGPLVANSGLSVTGNVSLTTNGEYVGFSQNNIAFNNTTDTITISTATNTVRLTVTGSLITSALDFVIGSLGQFDSTDVPLEGQHLVYHAGATNKWQAETFITIYGQGDTKVELMTDGSLTAVAYIFFDVGVGADSPVGAPPVPATPIVDTLHLSNSLEIRGYSKPADFRWFEWQYCTGASCAGWVALALTTSTKLVHSRLTSGTIYRYRVRVVDQAGNASAYSTATGDITAVRSSETQAWGSVIASEIAVANLAAISADFGIITAGQARNAGNTAGINFGGAGGIPGTWVAGINFETAAGFGSMTRYINFTATGANPIIKHEMLSLNADGTANFLGLVDIAAASLSSFGGNKWAIFTRDSIAHGMTAYAPTDVFGQLGTLGALTGTFLIQGYSVASGSGLVLQGNQGTGGTSLGALVLVGAKKSGTGLTDMAAGDLMFEFVNNATTKLKIFGNGTILPATDNVSDIGATGQRLHAIFVRQINLFDQITNGNPYLNLSWKNSGGTSRDGYFEGIGDNWRIYSATLGASIMNWSFTSGQVTFNAGVAFDAYAGTFRRSAGNAAFPDLYGDGTNALVIAGKADGTGTIKLGTLSSNLVFNIAASKIIPGATSLSHRNSADTADNLLIADNGDATVRGKVFIGGSIWDLGNNLVLVQNVGATGWGNPTGTATRTAFATTTVTLPQLAERVKALIDDLKSYHGLIKA